MTASIFVHVPILWTFFNNILVLSTLSIDGWIPEHEDFVEHCLADELSKSVHGLFSTMDYKDGVNFCPCPDIIGIYQDLPILSTDRWISTH